MRLLSSFARYFLALFSCFRKADGNSLLLAFHFSASALATRACFTAFVAADLVFDVTGRAAARLPLSLFARCLTTLCFLCHLRDSSYPALYGRTRSRAVGSYKLGKLGDRAGLNEAVRGFSGGLAETISKLGNSAAPVRQELGKLESRVSPNAKRASVAYVPGSPCVSLGYIRPR